MIQRRSFITLLGGAAVWPLAVRAQPTPVVGYLDSTAPDQRGLSAVGFRKGLSAMGYVEGAIWRSNTVVRETTTIDCGKWRPI